MGRGVLLGLVVCGLGWGGLVGGLAGCRLVDQRTFERAGAAPASADIAAAGQRAAAERPLLTVFLGQPDTGAFGAGMLGTAPPASTQPAPAWRAGLLSAVRDTLSRRPDATFTLVTLIPTGRDVAAQQAATATGAADAATVAAAMQGDGVAADSIHLAARGDPGHPARVVLVFTR